MLITNDQLAAAYARGWKDRGTSRDLESNRCINCDHQQNKTCTIFNSGYSLDDNFGCTEFKEKEPNAFIN